MLQKHKFWIKGENIQVYKPMLQQSLALIWFMLLQYITSNSIILDVQLLSRSSLYLDVNVMRLLKHHCS